MPEILHVLKDTFFAYKLGQIIYLFFSFPFISKYKFCVMLHYKYLKMKTIKIVYSLCFCFNFGKDMNSLPGSKTQPHCKHYTRKENLHVKSIRKCSVNFVLIRYFGKKTQTYNLLPKILLRVTFRGITLPF